MVAAARTEPGVSCFRNEARAGPDWALNRPTTCPTPGDLPPGLRGDGQPTAPHPGPATTYWDHLCPWGSRGGLASVHAPQDTHYFMSRTRRRLLVDYEERDHEVRWLLFSEL